MKLIFFSVLAFSMIGLIIPSVSAEIYVHQSDFPFSIQYPTGWEVFDEDEWGGVWIGDKTGRNGIYIQIMCSAIRGDDCGQAGADYQELDYLKQDSEYNCEILTMKEDYVTCRDLKFLEEFVVYLLRPYLSQLYLPQHLKIYKHPQQSVSHPQLSLG